MIEQKIPLAAPRIDGLEMHGLSRGIHSGFVAPCGPELDGFEADFAQAVGLPYTLAVSSGTAALHLALHALGISPGDIVPVSTLTFIGGVSPISFLGAIPAFIDSDPETWNMDPGLLENYLHKLKTDGETMPKAAVVTELYGQCIDYSRFREVCDKFGLYLVVDAAESLGGKFLDDRGNWRSAGELADVAIYSFNGNKMITGSTGGMLASKHADIIVYARKLATQAKEPCDYYEHTELGYNYRMGSLVASCAREQLRTLQDRVARKREIFEEYRQHLEDIPGIQLMPEAPGTRHCRWLTTALIDRGSFGRGRDSLIHFLAERGIEARPVWKPMHTQPVFRPEKMTNPRAKPCRITKGENAEDLFAAGLCLPSGASMDERDVYLVADAVKRAWKKG